MATYAKYLEKFIRRHENEIKKDKENHNYITDPHAYISFLECQLDKAAKSVYLIDGLNEKIDLMQTQIHSFNEKLNNTNKLYKIFESSKEAQVYTRFFFFLLTLRKKNIMI